MKPLLIDLQRLSQLPKLAFRTFLLYAPKLWYRDQKGELGMHGTAVLLISYLSSIVFHQKVFTRLVPVDNDSLCQLLQSGSGMPRGFPVSCTCLSLQWLPQFVPHGYDGLTLLDSYGPQ